MSISRQVARVRALRGATTSPGDDPEQILEVTGELLDALAERNSVELEDIVSILFTTTPDLTSQFPAVAVRARGWRQVPVMCAAEIAVPHALPLCVRVLMHVYTPLGYAELHHVYLRGASHLRPDLDETN